MQLGDYIVKAGADTVVPGKIVDEDDGMWVVEWGPVALSVIPKISTEHEVVGHGDPSKGWANKTK